MNNILFWIVLFITILVLMSIAQMEYGIFDGLKEWVR